MMDPEYSVLIDRYASGYTVVESALAGMSERELDIAEADGEWTPRLVIHHLADSEMWAAMRMRRLLAEDNPWIQGYDQVAYVETLLYWERPIQSSLQAFRYARETTAELLRRLPAEAFERGGEHEETGRITVGSMLAYYAEHAHDHAAQIRRARAVAAEMGAEV
jgi:hypothetical protein